MTSFPANLLSVPIMSASRTRNESDDEHNDEETALLPNPILTPKSNSNEYSTTYVKLCVIIFLVNIAFQVLEPAQLRIYERIFCAQWYQEHKTDLALVDGQVPENLCKIPAVQRQVSSLRGWLEFFEATPTLIMAIPIGILADIFGRRPFFRLELFAISLQQIWITVVTFFPKKIPIRAVWLEGILNFVSGGKMVAEMLVACVITDITPREQLPTAFFRLNAIAQLTQVLGPAIAGSLMHIDSWWAILAGLLMLLAMNALILTVPETLQRKQDYTTQSSFESDHDELGQAHSSMQYRFQSFRRTTVIALRELAIVWTDWRLLFLVLLYPFRMFGNALGQLLQIYVSNRYGWSLANAAFLYTLAAVCAAIVLFTLMPWLSDLVDRRYGLSAIQKNVVLTRVSILIIAVAYFVEGAAATVPLLIGGLVLESLGSGLPSTLRALAGVLVEQKDNGRVFSVLAISETLSTMFAFPTTTSLFNVGLEKGGGIWLGLPFFVTAGMAAAAFVVMSFLKFEKSPRI